MQVGTIASVKGRTVSSVKGKKYILLTIKLNLEVMTWPPKPGHAGVGNIGHKVGSSNMTLPMKYDQTQEA